MKILIIEDEAPAAKQLAKMLQKAEPSIAVIEPIDSVEAAVKWLNAFPSPDAIFMDIQIADGLSFAIFNQVEITCPVVFTTAFDQYAIKAFRVNALDYLLKPIDEDELNAVVYKLKTRTPPQYALNFLHNLVPQFTKPIVDFKTRFLIKQGTAFNFVETQDIAYFFSEDGLTQFYTIQNKKHVIEQSLDELDHQLNPSNYFRINRKIIVSIKSIKKISPHFNSRLKLELTPPYLTDIFVARERVGDFKTWLGG
ncbi:MAG: LytTR family DNA-binding domain-containing protein [Saprospiraceae bacterium]|nr:LytTR family DNA-binding domain-containing protein [Saprospiraceae bacterium]